MKTEKRAIELPELKIGLQPIPAIKGADVLISDRYQSTFGVVEKITSGWGGTVYVRTSINSIRKFDSNGFERATDSWHPTKMIVLTPEQKAERIRKQKEQKNRNLKASRLNNIKWDGLTSEQIESVYNLAINLGILNT